MGTGNSLEKFIKENRRDFDSFEPPADLWNKIEAGLDQKTKAKPLKDRVVKLKFVLRIAALFLLISTIGVVYINRKTKGSVDIASINPELAKQQSRYASIIEYKREELVQIKSQEPQLYHEFSTEIAKLQANYRKLQRDLKTSPNQEMTLRAMIKNMQVQADVLNQQLLIIQQLKQLKTEQKNEYKGI